MCNVDNVCYCGKLEVLTVGDRDWAKMVESSEFDGVNSANNYQELWVTMVTEQILQYIMVQNI